MWNRQFVGYLVLLVISAILTTVAYFQLRGEWILFHQGEDLYLKKDYKAAIPFYQAAIKEGVNSRIAYQHLGDAYTSEKQFADAVDIYKTYLQMHPNDREMRIRLARVLSYGGDFEESTKEYKKAVQDSKKEP